MARVVFCVTGIWDCYLYCFTRVVDRYCDLPAVQVSQLGLVAQKYQAATQNASSSPPEQELQNNCNK